MSKLYRLADRGHQSDREANHCVEYDISNNSNSGTQDMSSSIHLNADGDYYYFIRYLEQTASEDAWSSAAPFRCAEFVEHSGHRETLGEGASAERQKQSRKRTKGASFVVFGNRELVTSDEGRLDQRTMELYSRRTT